MLFLKHCPGTLLGFGCTCGRMWIFEASHSARISEPLVFQEDERFHTKLHVLDLVTGFQYFV